MTIKITNRLLIITALCGLLVHIIAQPQDEGQEGNLPGVKYWVLPNTENGLTPTQSWHSTGSAPDGDIYIGGMDHATNSALYRLSQEDDVLRYVGDSRAASEAVDNWENGETDQKYHCRPTWLNGVVYVASLDRSDINDAHLSTRGFHWYGYDIAQDGFADLSVDAPGGVGGEHVQIVTIVPDPANNLMYGLGIPDVEIASYNPATGENGMHGRPEWFERYIYTARFSWVDSRGRLYITAGSQYWSPNADYGILNHVHYYDPVEEFGELPDWELNRNAAEVGQWTRDRKHCYMSDNEGNFYRFDDDGPAWSYLGNKMGGPVFVFHVSPDGKKIYAANSNGGGKTLNEYDIASGETRALCSFGELHVAAGSHDWAAGYDAWDNDGNIYFGTFTMDNNPVILTRVNPVLVKIEKGMLPSLVEVSAEATPNGGGVLISRTGTADELRALYDIIGRGENGNELERIMGEAVIPEGSASVSVSVQDVRFSVPGVSSAELKIISDGNTYLAGAERIVSLNHILSVEPMNPNTTGGTLKIMPVHGTVLFQVVLNHPAQGVLRVYDPGGTLLCELFNSRMDAGIHQLKWNGKDKTGRDFSGLFFAVLENRDDMVAKTGFIFR